MRARITKELILRRGFHFVAVEADWPDAARINQYIRHAPARQDMWKAFARFPIWMWRNQEALELVDCNSETGSTPAGYKIVTVADSLGLESFTISKVDTNITVTDH
jgi:hypothetical protein